MPAAHGGFETFAEHLALFLVERGWRVVVYCQEDGNSPTFNDVWQGVERVRIPVLQKGPMGTIVFDWKATSHASRFGDLCLTLGYNTAVFCYMLRLKGVSNIINMDGIEWSRAKWGVAAKSWFWMNERAGCWLGNHLVADHPQIKKHLESRIRSDKITTIPYGADQVLIAEESFVRNLGLEPGRFLTVIARAEPENSLLEIVQGFSKKKRDCRLVVLGNYDDNNFYHRSIKNAASDEVVFPGAIYDKSVVQALRFFSLAYVHGHQVGGTNPSLVEALGAGNAVIAHDNRFNRWVAGEGATYFKDADSFSKKIDNLLSDSVYVLKLRANSRARFEQEFTWPNVLEKYERLLESFC